MEDENERDDVFPGSFPVSSNEEEEDAFDLQETLQRKGFRHEVPERIFLLLQFLTANECTRKEIFEHMASYYNIDTAVPGEITVSRSASRMFERDIKFLEDLGFEIKKVRKRGQSVQYSIVKGTGPRIAFIFKESEVDSLALLYNLFADPTRYAQAGPTQPLPQQPPRSPFAEEILALIEKFASTLPPEQKRRFDRWTGKPYIYFNMAPVTDYLPHRATINTIVRAIASRQQIRFDYMPTHRKQEVIPHEHIDPYYIIHMEGHFYLIGYSHKTEQFLEYRIDRIKQETVKIGPDVIDVERRRRPIEFSFWIDSNIARHGLSQRWLTQVTEREEAYLDEYGRQRTRVLVRATAYNEWRVRQQLLRYGEQAELVEPQWLREKMKKTVERMSGLYEDKNN